MTAITITEMVVPLDAILKLVMIVVEDLAQQLTLAMKSVKMA